MLHLVNFPSGHVSRVSKSRLIEISDIRLIHPRLPPSAPLIAPQTGTPLSVTITTVGRKCAGEKTVPLSLSLSVSLFL